MDKHIAHHELIDFLKSNFLRKRLLLFRGDAELHDLSAWISSDDDVGRAIAHVSDLKQLIEKCNLCNDAGEKKFGFGNGRTRVMVILNAPQLVNVLERKVHRKESVELLKKIIHAAGIVFQECYVTNLVKCDVRDPLINPSEVVKNCEMIIGKEIEIMKPRIVIVFGDILPLQKIIKETDDVYWYNIEHPITLIKNPELKRPAWNTLKLIMGKMKELNIP
jgi:uracil-DNA glycosylase family 4